MALLFVHGTANAVHVEVANTAVRAAVERHVLPAAAAAGVRVEFGVVNYAAPLAARQDAVFERVVSASAPAWVRAARHVTLKGLSVGMSYFSSHGFRGDAHDVVCDALVQLAARAGAGARLVVVGHSLGSVLLTDIISALQSLRRPVDGAAAQARAFGELGCAECARAAPVERVPYVDAPRLARRLGARGLALVDRLGAVCTAGGPFCWFFPVSRALRRCAASHGWYNFYYRCDVLTSPVLPLGPAFADAVDCELRAGWHPLKHTPASHVLYMSDAALFAAVGTLVAAVALDPPCPAPLRVAARGLPPRVAQVVSAFARASPAAAPPALRLRSSTQCHRCRPSLRPHGLLAEVNGALRACVGARVGVLYLHGMGAADDVAAQNAIAFEAVKRMAAAGAAPSIVYNSVNYAAPLQGAQSEVLRRVTAAVGGWWHGLRRVVLSSWPVCMGFMSEPWLRRHVLGVMDAAVQEMRDIGGAGLPIIVVAHDLGGVIGASWLSQQRHTSFRARRNASTLSLRSVGSDDADGIGCGANDCGSGSDANAPTVERLVSFGCPMAWFGTPLKGRAPSFAAATARGDGCGGGGGRWINVHYDCDACATALQRLDGAMRGVRDVELHWRERCFSGVLARLIAAVRSVVRLPWRVAGAMSGAYLHDARCWRVVRRAVAVAARRAWAAQLRAVVDAADTGAVAAHALQVAATARTQPAFALCACLAVAAGRAHRGAARRR